MSEENLRKILRSDRSDRQIDLCAVLFVGLKLANIISWSWWLVLSPMIFGYVVDVIAMIIKIHYEADND